MKSPAQIITIAKSVIRLEAEEINALEGKINDAFAKAVALILSSEGRVIVAGVGKSANIASKIVATLNSTGQPAVFLHAADAIHGDLGMVKNKDVVILISYSGETEEIIKLLTLVTAGLSGSPSTFFISLFKFPIPISFPPSPITMLNFEKLNK